MDFQNLAICFGSQIWKWTDDSGFTECPGSAAGAAALKYWKSIDNLAQIFGLVLRKKPQMRFFEELRYHAVPHSELTASSPFSLWNWPWEGYYQSIWTTENTNGPQGPKASGGASLAMDTTPGVTRSKREVTSDSSLPRRWYDHGAY